MTATRRLRLIVFDCDGTLIDSQATIVAAMTAACRERNRPAPDAALVRRIVGLPLAVGVGRLFPSFDSAEIAGLADDYKAAFGELRRAGTHDEPLYPGIFELVGKLKTQGYALGIATGKSRRGLGYALDRHGMRDYFVTLQTADDGPGKPHPHLLERAMLETGARADETAMIGDTVFDVEMARAAGAQAIGVAWGYHEPGELAAAGASVVAANAAEIWAELGSPEIAE